MLLYLPFKQTENREQRYCPQSASARLKPINGFWKPSSLLFVYLMPRALTQMNGQMRAQSMWRSRILAHKISQCRQTGRNICLDSVVKDSVSSDALLWTKASDWPYLVIGVNHLVLQIKLYTYSSYRTEIRSLAYYVEQCECRFDRKR